MNFCNRVFGSTEPHKAQNLELAQVVITRERETKHKQAAWKINVDKQTTKREWEGGRFECENSGTLCAHACCQNSLSPSLTLGGWNALLIFMKTHSGYVFNINSITLRTHNRAKFTTTLNIFFFFFVRKEALETLTLNWLNCFLITKLTYLNILACFSGLSSRFVHTKNSTYSSTTSFTTYFEYIVVYPTSE